jgi:hypothetical protein
MKIQNCWIIPVILLPLAAYWSGTQTCQLTSTPAPKIVPGGVWLTPIVGQILHSRVHFEAHAYPTHQGEPQIDHVNFTVESPPDYWQIACVAASPQRRDVFACNADFPNLEVIPGSVTVSFDVYDKAGNKNLAPNGLHKFIYQPGLGWRRCLASVV